MATYNFPYSLYQGCW